MPGATCLDTFVHTPFEAWPTYFFPGPVDLPRRTATFEDGTLSQSIICAQKQGGNLYLVWALRHTRLFCQHFFDPCFPVPVDECQHDTRQTIPTILYLRLIEDRVTDHEMHSACVYDKLLVSPALA